MSIDNDRVRVDRTSESSSRRASDADGFSPHFSKFLADNGYGDFDFAKPGAAAFGGKQSAADKVTRQPVILVHGNSDTAQGWRTVIKALKEEGYEDAEIYALTYGPGRPSLAALQHHSKDDLEDIRAFVEAVLEYTGADQVDLISHSLGVTLSRQAVKGGAGCDVFRDCYDLGEPLSDRVDAFIGIAGANQGLSTTRGWGALLPTGNRVSGLHPDSKFLADLNADPTKEGQRVYSIGGKYDQILGRDAGTTDRIPGEDDAVTGPWGHFGARTFSTEYQLRLLQKSLSEGTVSKRQRQAERPKRKPIEEK